MRKSVKKDGFVYVLISSGYFKIGRSKSPQRRLSDLQMATPHKIDLYMHVHTERPDYVEKELHLRFHNKRKRGEWYELSNEDLYELERLMTLVGKIHYNKNVKRIKYSFRDEGIKNMRQEGATYAQIAKSYGITRQRAHQICSGVEY